MNSGDVDVEALDAPYLRCLERLVRWLLSGKYGPTAGAQVFWDFELKLLRLQQDVQLAIADTKKRSRSKARAKAIDDLHPGLIARALERHGFEVYTTPRGKSMARFQVTSKVTGPRGGTYTLQMRSFDHDLPDMLHNFSTSQSLVRKFAAQRDALVPFLEDIVTAQRKARESGVEITPTAK